jgi:tripartite-type tricarboxylate transporter receptor subunit TctC
VWPTKLPAAPNIPVHVPQDFLPIGFVAENPMFIAVSPSLGISTLPELIARAKKAPGEITYATTAVGRLTHLTGELLQPEAGIKLLLVPYTGGPSHAVTDVATGRVAMMIEGYLGVAGAARSDSIKLIAVASAKRLAEFLDVPTVAETISWFPSHWLGCLGSAYRHARGDHRQDQRDLRKVTLDPELQRKLAPLGSYTSPMSAAETAAFVHKQQQTWQLILDEITKISDEDTRPLLASMARSARAY